MTSKQGEMWDLLFLPPPQILSPTWDLFRDHLQSKSVQSSEHKQLCLNPTCNRCLLDLNAFGVGRVGHRVVERCGQAELTRQLP